MNYELRIRTAVRKILILAGFISLILFSPFHSYSQPPDHKSKTDKFGGIGVSVDIDSSVMLPYIVDILSAKPGAMAGLRSGDHIISINGWKTKGKSQEKVAGKLRGRVGSEVNLAVNRGGQDTGFSMKREHIEVNETAGNLCDGLKALIDAGKDSFAAMKGENFEQSQADKSRGTFVWKSTLKLPGFQKGEIIKEKDTSLEFDAVFFVGKDTFQVKNQYDKLVSDIEGCVPYIQDCNIKEDKVPLPRGSGYSTYYYINKINNFKISILKRSKMRIVYFHFPPDPAFVVLSYELTP